ncbi:DegT/DnrJ/EryC1/StrS aminotransferase family protein [Synechococcus sp. NOUM97013]|uniref:DegT/DnrJ/EryC1/StrS family aminotransferase n=1 Tax=Synechococcus sp. NOUM97013 TaxID=1442555 RepID=UPI001646762F|nr:DegT/DnrJ/EryC1/StrS family aminotransferase [Synechococcus sp. NOUM97013]QNI72323.1 perosamine synthetase protein family [Synechococcus sp. NOUM97013]
MSPQIPVFKPLIEKEEISAAVKSLELGWLGMGSYVQQFEKAVADICNFAPDSNKYVVAVSTGHAALHLSLLMIGVGPGDEVITPSFNNAADFQAIRACGAEPVFVDIDENTLCIDPTKIEELITDKTRCIIAMDYDIFISDHAALAEISLRTGIPILHDAAHSFGSTYKGRPIGNQHQYTMFSFDPVKTITCIDGGAVIVSGEDALKKLQAKRLIGMTQSAAQMYTNSRAWTYDIEELGFRYHMPNLHAAIGVSQIDKIDEIRYTRQQACMRYYNELSVLDWIEAPKGDFNSINPFLYYVKVLNGKRTELREHMKRCGVDTGIHWQAGHNFSFLKECRRGSLDVTNRIVDQILSLPLHSKMSPHTLDQVIESVRSFNCG